MTGSSRSLFSTQSPVDRAALAAGFIIIAALVCDLAFSAFLDSLGGQMVSAAGIAIFAALAIAIYGAGLRLLTGFVRQLSKGVRSKSRFFGLAYQAVVAIQYVLIGIFAVVAIEMALFSSYRVALLAAAVAVSLAPAALIMAVHSYRFLSWFWHRKNALVLLYGLAPGLASAATAVMIYIDLYRLLAMPATKEPVQQATIQLISSIPALGGLFVYAYVLPLVLSLVIIWIGTALHLRHYSEKMGRARYWAMIWMPVVSFVVVLFVNVGLIMAGGAGDSMFGVSRLALFSSATASIVVIGISFLTMAWSLPREGSAATLRGHLVLAGLGVMAQSISLMTFVYGNYPPFGILGHSFLALASYVYIMGLYSSAVSVSRDIDLRKSIKKLAESRLLDGIGAAQMERELQARVFAIAKNHIDAAEGVQQPSLSEDEIRRYIDEVASELKKGAAA